MIHELMRHLVMWIYHNPTWAGLVLFLLSAGESMTFIGTFIPGTIVMTAVGIFIGADLLPYWPMVLWAACGTLLGDALNFTLGYFLKDNIKQIWPFKKRQHWILKGQQFFEKHGGKSVYFARFIGPLRAFAPIIAGAMRMAPSKFYFIDTLSAFTWAIVYLLPGILLGEASLELSPDITEHLFRFVFLSLIAIILSIWLLRLLILHVNEVIKNALSCLWMKIKETPALDFLAHCFRHHNTHHPRGQLGTLLVFIVVLSAFIGLSLSVTSSSSFILSHNNELYHFAESLRMQWLDHTMLIITLLGEKEIIGPLTLLLIIFFLVSRCYRAAFFIGGALALGVVVAYVLKSSIHFPRPSPWFQLIDGFSYPSGHVVISTIFYGGLAYLTAASLPLKLRWLPYSIAIIIILAVASSRIFLGVHWSSDVLGSILLGWLCLLLMAFFYQRHAIKPIPIKTCLPILLCIEIFSVWGYLEYFHARLLKDYQLPHHSQVEFMNLSAWWQKQNAHVPRVATNRFGMPKELLNVQWLGKKEAIESLLKTQGWRSAMEAHNWVLEIQHPEETEIPAPHLNFKLRYLNNMKPSFVFYKPLTQTPHAYMVLQLWQTPLTIESLQESLMLGNLSVRTDDKSIKASISETRLLADFSKSLENAAQIKIIKTQKALSSNTAINEAPLILIRSKT